MAQTPFLTVFQLQINLYPIVYDTDTNIKKTINNINLKLINETSKNKADDNKNFKTILNNYLPPTNFYLSYANYKTLEIQKNYSKSSFFNIPQIAQNGKMHE